MSGVGNLFIYNGLVHLTQLMDTQAVMAWGGEGVGQEARKGPNSNREGGGNFSPLTAFK